MIDFTFCDKSFYMFDYLKEMELFEVNTTEVWDSFIKKNKEFSKFQFILDYKLFLKDGLSIKEKEELGQEEAPYTIINVVSRKHYSDKELRKIRNKILEKGMFVRFIGNA